MTSNKEISLTARGDGFKLIPSSLEDAQKVAAYLGKSSMLPKSFRDDKGQPRESDMVVAMLWGAELGMSALKSIQSIDIVPGRAPSLKVEAMRAVVLGSHECEYMFDRESLNEAGELMGMETVIKRKGHPEYVGSFTIDQAKRASLWGKAGPWTQYPRRMLAARAAGFAMRDKFADVLGGLTYTTEESSDIPNHGNHAEEALQTTMKVNPSDKLADLLSASLPVEEKITSIEGDLELESDVLIDEEDAR